MQNHICLASPLHDPQSRLLPAIRRSAPKLLDIYAGQVAVSVTENTASQVIRELLALNVRLTTQSRLSGMDIGSNYRQALRKGLETSTQAVHLVDFDRALHWATRFPEELADACAKLSSLKGLTSFVRSKRAFETHPSIQRSTEATINAIAAEVVGHDVDIMSGAFGMDRDTGRIILEQSHRQDFGVYAELLKVAVDRGIQVNTLEVEGLEWETPDQFQDEIEKRGYMQWLNDFESLQEWEKRIRLIDDSKDVLLERKMETKHIRISSTRPIR